MSSLPTTRRKVADVLLATALASSVLPVPGSHTESRLQQVKTGHEVRGLQEFSWHGWQGKRSGRGGNMAPPLQVLR